MSSYGYVQLFLFGLICCGAISAGNGTCSAPPPQSNIHKNQVLGDWFVSRMTPGVAASKDECVIFNVKEINETTLNLTVLEDGAKKGVVFSIESPENAGSWHVDVNKTWGITLSTDGTTLAMTGCFPDTEQPECVLLSKQLPISAEHAAITGDLCNFVWKSEATCRLP